MSTSTSVPLPVPKPVDIISEGTARLPRPPAIVSAGPASGQVGVVFTSKTTGYLAAVPRAQTSGYAGGATSEIERTTDGGLSWKTVWRGSDVVLHWVGARGAGMVAAGLGAHGPVLVESAQGRPGWREVPVTLSLPAAPNGAGLAGGADWYWATSALTFVDEHVGFDLPDAMYGQDAPAPSVLLRTADGGRHWSAVALPGGSPSGGLAFVDAEHGFATGFSAPTSGGSQPRGCTSRIWRTADAGASWHAVAGTCAGYLLTSLSFPTPERGFAGGGNYAKYGQVPQLAVLATADGGRIWSQVFAAPTHPAVAGGGYGGPFGQLEFYDATHGVALAGGCTMGANGPCRGQVWSTDDGGRSWAEEGVLGAQLALAGRIGAWVAGGMPGSSVLWRSSDRGRAWSPVAGSAGVGLSGLLAAGRDLWVGSEAGQFLSVDGGTTWHGLPAATMAAVGGALGGAVSGLGRSGALVAQTGAGNLWLSEDGGREGRTVPVPGLGGAGAAAVSFADGRHGLVLGWGSCAATKPLQPPVSLPLRPSALFATDDAGRSWRHVADLDVAGYGGLAYSRAVAVVAATCTKGIATSTDGGASWAYWALPTQLSGCRSPSTGGTTVVLYCPSYGADATTLRLLVSNDAGRRWSVLRLTGWGAAEVQGVVAGGPGVLWAFGQRSAEVWRSTDGGENWGAVDLGLPVAP